jgi:hypothetical protein
MKKDLAPFYASAVVAPEAVVKELVSTDTESLSLTPYRRFGCTPY